MDETIYQHAFDASPCGMMLVDSDGRILKANHALETMFDYSEGVLSGQKIEKLVPDAHAIEHVKLRNAYLQNPSKRPMGQGRELKGMRLNGSTFPVEVGLTPIVTGSSRIIAVSVIDLSQQVKLAKRVLAKKEDLETFLYTVSHDLKSPIVSIGGFVSRILRSNNNLDVKTKHYLERIEANVRSMESMLKGLLNISRISHRDLDLEEVDITNLLNTIVNNNSQIVENENASVNIGQLPTLKCDYDKMQQVFLNLILNALKYCPEGRKPKIEIGSYEEKNQMVVYIKDNAEGFKDSDKDRAFRIFERFNIEKEGTGVGLAIVKSIIEKHGGKVGIESQVGQGSTFFLKFPIS